ncbi:MAG: cytochrome c oxidase subunit II [Chloroflexi bacterium]|nr:cytochrome c oxidase subunit II [Chloroflexota bacterium]
MKRHILILTLLIGGLSTIFVVFFLNFPLAPVPATAESLRIDSLMRILFSIGSVIFTIVTVFLVYSVVVFRRRRGDTGEGAPIQGHTGLEILWTVVPLAIVITLGVYGGLVLRDIAVPARVSMYGIHDSSFVGKTPGVTPSAGASGQAWETPLRVKVTSSQWSWLFEYPEWGITYSELWLPVGTPVLLTLTSKDVIHSFFVPEFRVKMDAVPGMETQLRLTPIVSGEYQLQCAELCGLAHAYMVAKVKVVEEQEFKDWLKERRR